MPAGRESRRRAAPAPHRSATGRERALLPVPLERDAGERMPRIIGGRDADDDARIGVALVARILAHAVGHHAAGLGGRRHHRAAGTHAEAVDRAAVAARDAPACSRRRRAGDVRRRRRSGSDRSATADARCARRSRTASPPWRRRDRRASGTCRGRCGRPPARHDRQRCACRRRARRRAPAGCRPALRRSSRSVTLLSKRYSPPSASMVSRMLSTIVTSRKVPICGLAT